MGYTDKWILLTEVEELYDNITSTSVTALAYSLEKEGKDISHLYRAEDTTARVNMGYLEYVWERRRRIQFECQDFYYRAREKMSEASLTRKYSTYSGKSYHTIFQFLNRTLFTNYYYTSLTSISISSALIEFHNFCNELLCEVEFDSIEEKFDYYELQKILYKQK